jgi:Domain of unknown function (DUF2703)
MKTLPILWQRLVSAQGSTCPRCQSTGEEIHRAVRKLQQALEPLGVMPELQVKDIDQASFLKDPLQSNQILVAGHTLEHWLGGQTGRSPCCNECGDKLCRTVEVGGQSHEVIPEDWLVRAGLMAGAWILSQAPLSQGDPVLPGPKGP